MNTAFVAVVWKEAVDGLRDRRSLVAALAYSLFGPLVLAWALIAIGEETDRGKLELALAGAEHAPELAAFLAASDITAGPAPADPEGALRRRETDVVLRIDPDFALHGAEQRPATVELLYDSSRRSSVEKARRVDEALRRFDLTMARVRLLARGIAPSAVQAIAVERRDFASPAARAAVALGMLPMFLLLAAFVASMNAAIDATAGERERGSLEALLVHPVSRQALARGKWLASAALAAIGVVLTLLAAERALAWERVRNLDLALGLDRADLATFLALLLPLALLAPAAQLSIALVSHNFKEAQTYLSLSLFVPMLPGFFFSFSNRDPAPWMDWVPLLGQQVVMTRVLRGEVVTVATLVGLGAATVVLALAAITFTGWLFGRERIVLGR